jgi:hypothetical protein
MVKLVGEQAATRLPRWLYRSARCPKHKDGAMVRSRGRTTGHLWVCVACRLEALKKEGRG